VSPRLALAFVVTVAVAVGFAICSMLSAIAAFRWAFDLAPGGQLVRALIAWLVSFVLMQAWSFWLGTAAA